MYISMKLLTVTAMLTLFISIPKAYSQNQGERIMRNQSHREIKGNRDQIKRNQKQKVIDLYRASQQLRRIRK